MKVCWFSTGISSFVACYLAKDVDEIIYTHVPNQHPDSLRFLHDCERVLRRKITILQSEDARLIGRIKMRIISQDGKYDAAYERVSFRREGTNIYMSSTEYSNLRIAEYSIPEKAIKAMQMCREHYLSRMELGGGYDIVNKYYVQPNYWVLPKVFQFPADEEVEV